MRTLSSPSLRGRPSRFIISLPTHPKFILPLDPAAPPVLLQIHGRMSKRDLVALPTVAARLPNRKALTAVQRR